MPKDTVKNKENDNNISCYENFSVDIFQTYLKRSGIDNNADLNFIKDSIIDTNSILEVGAGYGRVIDFLISNEFKGKIVAIEQSFRFNQYLQQKFQNHATIHHTNLSDFSSMEKFETILWLWCGISDIPKQDQFLMIKKLASFLKKNGLLFIDTLPIQPDDVQSQILIVNGCEMSRYYPTIEEIDYYADKLKLTKKHLQYTTSPNGITQARNMHILKNEHLTPFL